MPSSSSVVPVKVEKDPEAGRDPLIIMIEIAENQNLSDQDKTALILYSKERFKNRRLMAYVALYSLVAALGFLFLAAFIDGLSNSTILESIKGNQTLFSWLGGFLTTIVAAYYGVSAWRPAS
jgi:hypothetical protein